MIKHPKFDPSTWMEIYDEQPYVPDCWTCPMVIDPLSACEIVIARSLASTVPTAGRESPTDVFLWRLGDPIAPYLTKFGGVPYMRKSTPWPRGESGKPAEFLCQINFCDSIDIAGELIQGDVLLVFCDNRIELDGDKTFYFAWETVEPDHDLRGLAEVEGPSQFITCSGEVWRTFNLVDWMFSPLSWDLKLDDGRDVYFPYKLFALHATQIGARPFPFVLNLDRLNGRRLLCCLTSVGSIGYPYPFLNHAAPIAMSDERSQTIWTAEHAFFEFLGDGETLYVFVAEDGTLEAETQCS